MADDRAMFRRASWANVASNVAKLVVEGGLGLATGSLALLADAAHSIADLLASAVVLVWGRLAYEGPDATHPHGHDRFESLSALFVGIVLVFLGLNLLYDSVLALQHGSEATYTPMLVVGLLIALAIKAATAWYTKRANEKAQSTSLDALVRDNLNDIYTTTAALVGVVGMAFGYPVFDPIAGGLVSLLVVYEGGRLCRENVAQLSASAPPDDVQTAIRDRVTDHPDVHGVHDFTAYYTGPVIEVEFHAEIDADHTLADAHDIETDVRRNVLAHPAVADAHVHLDPAGMDEWKDADDTTRRPPAATRTDTETEE